VSKKLLVVAAVYNNEKYLKRAIESVLNQTYTNFDLIIVDDASTDNSFKVAQNFLNDSRVKIIKNNINAGCFYSKNVGLKFMESGKYDIFTSHDSDDYSDPTRFEKIIELFEDNVLCVEPCEIRIGEGIPEWLPKEPRTIFSHLFLSKTAFEIFGYFDNAVCSADHEYSLRLSRFANLNKNYKILYHNELLYYSQMTNDSMLTTYSTQYRRAYIEEKEKEIKKMKATKDFYKPFFTLESSAKIKYDLLSRT
jgi:glycosyltransferase involved in cell wall biosynthesis